GGLALGHGLRARGKDVVVLEASARPGGTIHTFREQGFIAEAGPNGFLDKEPATGRLIAALGLAGKVKVAEPTTKKRFVWLNGQVQPVPTSPPAFLPSHLLRQGPAARARAALHLRGRPLHADRRPRRVPRPRAAHRRPGARPLAPGRPLARGPPGRAAGGGEADPRRPLARRRPAAPAAG